ncbi:MAG: hypothetical protein DCC58_17360 [Chloroflexi bacterium]|nr:MAG: hypothetical protein DCC58_17360 [Chloroflexota bacterium]
MSSNTALPDQDTINQFIIRCHFDLAAVQAAVAEYPALVGTVSSVPGAEGETPLGAAAHVGNRAIAEYLLDHGAELEFCAAVMLGMDDYVRAIVDADPGMANASGAHTIPALNHATVAGQAGLARYLVERGAAVTGGRCMARSTRVMPKW